MNTPYSIVIPARYDSVRLPGKPLREVAGRPLIEHVWRAGRAADAEAVVIATDDERIAEAARGFGAECVMTSREHASGSDRIAECARILGWPDDRLIVNLQGDEPEMPADCLDQVAGLLASRDDAVAATLCWPIDTAGEVEDPNAVKVVMGRGEALWFSRAPVPWPRGHGSIGEALAAGVTWYRHLGLYCYRNHSLQRFAASPPGVLESVEHLEQLRFLESGGRILIAQALRRIPPGIDTENDLEQFRQACLG